MSLNLIVSPPEWLKTQALENSSANTSGQPSFSKSLSGTMFSSGRRNQDFVKTLGLFRRNGMDEEQMIGALEAMNGVLPEPLDHAELLRTIQSSFRWEASEIQAITHVNFADFLIEETKKNYRYVLGDGFWLYRDTQWERDQEGLLLLNEAVKLSDRIKAEVIKLHNQVSSDDYKALKRAAAKTQNVGFLKSSIEIFKSKEVIRTIFEEFNTNKSLLNLKNGAYCLETAEPIPHKPEHMFTWSLDVSYEPTAECPKFDAFMDQILSKTSQRLLMQLIACSVIGEATNEQKFVFLTGQGRNGKSTFVKIMQGILGTLCAEADPSSFMRQLGSHIPNDLARLAGKRLVFTSETKSGDIMASELMKRMTGGDKLLARFLQKEFFEFTAEFIPFIVTNYLPVIDGSDFALKRRIIIIPFDQVIPESDVVRGLENIILQERDGIFNRILKAIDDYRSNGLVIPSEISQIIEKYVDGSNLIKRFYDENIEQAEGVSITAREMFMRYELFCKSLNVKAQSEPVFKANFERATNIMQTYNSRGNWWPNLRWSVNDQVRGEASVGLFQVV